MLLNSFAQYLKTRSDDSFRVVVQNEPSEEGFQPNTDLATVRQAEVVEGDSVQPHEVGRPDGTCFTHFLDGTQTTRRIGFYQRMIPIVYGFIGAVIRQRGADRRMSTHDKDLAENLYFSHAHLDPADLKSAGIALKDASEKPNMEGDQIEVHPLKLLEVARQAVSNDRAELERILADKWIGSSSSDDWLFWDGSITSSTQAGRHGRVVGVIKSHQTQYFSGEDQRKVLSLKVGERSSVFQPRIREWNPVYSWYLRLHPNEGKDVYFGLIRVEAAALSQTIGLADEISRWLLAERAPLALPDGRWDRMIYPIRDCEQYLRSISPSKVAIEAALAGVG